MAIFPLGLAKLFFQRFSQGQRVGLLGLVLAILPKEGFGLGGLAGLLSIKFFPKGSSFLIGMVVPKGKVKLRFLANSIQGPTNFPFLDQGPFRVLKGGFKGFFWRAFFRKVRFGSKISLTRVSRGNFWPKDFPKGLSRGAFPVLNFGLGPLGLLKFPRPLLFGFLAFLPSGPLWCSGGSKGWVRRKPFKVPSFGFLFSFLKGGF